jgi:hypothetical protein
MRVRLVVGSLVGLLVLLVALLYLAPTFMGEWLRPGRFVNDVEPETDTVEVTEYHAPQQPPVDEMVDDQLSDKNPEFVPNLVDRRHEGEWIVNASSAVLKLDVPLLLPDQEAALLVLRPSYADAIANAPASMKVLPSINLIDGKAKQFDDGLFAAIDLAHFKGLKPKLVSVVSVIERLHERVRPESAASAYLAAGLKFAGVEVKPARPDQVSDWLQRFEASAMDSKPFSFYTWSEDLARVFRFMRFFQQKLPGRSTDLIKELASALGSDPRLLEDYQTTNAFNARLTNPLGTHTLADVGARAGRGEDPASVAVFPSSRSKETELFRRLFPLGLAPGADLMRELIHAIRKGDVDLTPRADGGWYEYQVYALETFLMPEKGQEHPKLLLTGAYKKRMLEAFAALMTKRRETHARSLEVAKVAAAPPLTKFKPRLRVEPCPTYYLRTARSYDFVLNFLVATVGADGLASLYGLKEGGGRARPLLEELRWMRELFYGLHLLSAEDIGMAPALHSDEPVDRAACEATANDWLASYSKDADLKVDTRVSVPIFFDAASGRTRLWTTIGVRLSKLDASYARAPKIKPAQGSDDWREVDPHQLEGSQNVIAVDEFAEAEIRGLQPLTRTEFRQVCDAYKTKAEIVQALGRR